jgi:hypothetical protein
VRHTAAGMRRRLCGSGAPDGHRVVAPFTRLSCRGVRRGWPRPSRRHAIASARGHATGGLPFLAQSCCAYRFLLT